jgi:hypothetical protein
MSKNIRSTMIAVILGLALGQPRSGAARSGADASAIQMRDLKQWAFEGGPWSETSEGLMEPPEEFQEYYTAFYQPKTFGDLNATFQFRLEQVFCDAGMIVHAKDAQHYYLVHFPTAGQQWRAKHFWVAISRVDASGYKHVLKLAMVPQVNSNLFVWHEARVVVEKNELQVWVDGHFAAEAPDPGLSGAGRVGVAGFAFNPPEPGQYAQPIHKFSIRNLRVQGDAIAAPAWPAAVHPVKNWFHPCPDGTYGKWQLPPSIIRTLKGDLLMAFEVTNAGGLTTSTSTQWVMSRSTDNGQHWSKPEPPQATWPHEIAKGDQGGTVDRGGTLFVTADHRLMFQDIVTSGELGDRVYIAESKDDGHTWGEVRKAEIIGEWPKDPSILYPYGPILLLRDGTLLTTVQGSTRSSAMEYYEFQWGAPQSQAFSIRSVDGGKSWSAPNDLDGSPAIPQADKPRSTNLDLTESSCVQLKDGAVKCFIRPNNSPYMWVTESKDSGQSWGPTTFGPFPGYAANAYGLSAGAILVSHRLPDLAINTSYDDGLNWDQGTIVGTDIWAQGDMVEVAPDVVLFVYMDTRQGFLRGQFIRVTPHGLEPVIDMLPKAE